MEELNPLPRKAVYFQADVVKKGTDSQQAAVALILEHAKEPMCACTQVMQKEQLFPIFFSMANGIKTRLL